MLDLVSAFLFQILVFWRNNNNNTRYVLRSHLEGHAIRRKAEEKDDRIRKGCCGGDGGAVGAAGGRLGRDNHRRTRGSAFAYSRQYFTHKYNSSLERDKKAHGYGCGDA